jgi:hypothetical protein
MPYFPSSTKKVEILTTPPNLGASEIELISADTPNPVIF